MKQRHESAPPAEIILRLSWPPTVNHSWRVGSDGRPKLNAKAKQWRRNAVTEALVQGVRRVRLGGSIAIDILAIPPDGHVRDLDNLLKPTLDALTAAGIIADDRFVDELRIARGRPDPGEGRLVVRIRQKGA